MGFMYVQISQIMQDKENQLSISNDFTRRVRRLPLIETSLIRSSFSLSLNSIFIVDSYQ